MGRPLNPGTAWQTRADVWTEFLVDDGHGGLIFDYSYAERYNPVHSNGYEWISQVHEIIEELKIHPDSRQLYLSVWDPHIDIKNLGKHRVPCTLGYLFQNRGGQLHVTYMMRSCDFATHFQNDLYLSTSLRNFIAAQAGVKIGRFTHFVGSFHIYNKDVKGVF